MSTEQGADGAPRADRTPRPRLVLGTSQYQEEANAYFQKRLRIFYGVALAAIAGLYLATHVSDLVGGWWEAGLFVQPASLVHAGTGLLVALIWLRLRGRPLEERSLANLDLLAAVLSVAAGTTIYALLYEMGVREMVPVVALFLIARAVVVPSSALRTFLLGLPAPAGFLAVQLAKGTHWYTQGVRVDPADFVPDVVIWDQVVFALGITVATVASRVNFSLRLKADEARRLGQYRLEEMVGEGGMGQVYRATHALLRRPTAIKLLRPDLTGEETLRRFEREVRQTSRLTHPNTVAIFDFGRTPDGIFYYAMEYLDGADLRRVVQEGGPLPAARCLHVLTQACGALHEAHATGLVHRDIKPGNLFLCRQGGEWDVTKLLDFGLVKDVRDQEGSLTHLGGICGTPETLAPEVLGGDPASPACDLYALAVVAYYMLTGMPVFRANTIAEFIGHHLHTQPAPLREHDPTVPADLEAIVLRCLSKDPAARPADARSLREELRGCADSGRWTQADAEAWWTAFRARGSS